MTGLFPLDRLGRPIVLGRDQAGESAVVDAFCPGLARLAVKHADEHGGAEAAGELEALADEDLAASGAVSTSSLPKHSRPPMEKRWGHSQRHGKHHAKITQSQRPNHQLPGAKHNRPLLILSQEVVHRRHDTHKTTVHFSQTSAQYLVCL